MGIVYGAFGVGIFNICILLPISILLSPIVMCYGIYALFYWFFKLYVIQ
jgi:hypothetical protein